MSHWSAFGPRPGQPRNTRSSTRRCALTIRSASRVKASVRSADSSCLSKTMASHSGIFDRGVRALQHELAFPLRCSPRVRSARHRWRRALPRLLRLLRVVRRLHSRQTRRYGPSRPESAAPTRRTEGLTTPSDRTARHGCHHRSTGNRRKVCQLPCVPSLFPRGRGKMPDREVSVTLIPRTAKRCGT